MRLITIKYNSLDEFLQTIISKPINMEVFGNPPSSETVDYAFSGTHSFEEAWNLCRYTQDEGFANFKSLFNAIAFKTSASYNKKNVYKCAGYAPNVGRYLKGYPNDMHNVDLVQNKKGINITMNCAYSCFENKDAIINRGVCVLNLIQYLENRGFEVNFQFEDITYSRDEMIKIVIVIKKPQEKLNIKYCYFPLVNPSFLRRLMFRALEILPNIGRHWRYGYGTPYIYSFEEMRKIDNTIYITTPKEMGIEGKNINLDFDNFINYIKRNYSNLFDEEGKNTKRRVR